MKRHRLSSCCVLLIASVFFFFGGSCQKRNVTTLCKNQIVPVDHSQKTNNQYVIFCNLGHDGSKCKGCLMMDGHMVHVDCQGAGEMCRKASRVSLISTDTTLYATTLDTVGFTDLDILNMPSRSFSLEIDEGVYSYLNVPAQLVYRDTATKQFTFTGLSFTGRPLYGNN